MMMAIMTINSVQQVYIKFLVQQHKCQLLSRKKECKNTKHKVGKIHITAMKYNTVNEMLAQKPNILYTLQNARICLNTNSRFPKDIDVFAQLVSSRNTSSGQKSLTGYRKQGGVRVIIIIIIIIITADRKVVQKEAEKKLKYKSLSI
jgi:uncharacterized membrane protein